MKTLFVIVVAVFMASCASAVIDPGENSVGLYFDENADIFCQDGIGPFETIYMYLILANPTFDSLYGWECGMEMVGNAIFLGFQFHPGYMGWPPNSFDNMIIGYGTPYPTTMATPLVRLSFLYTDTNLEPVAFFVHGTTPSSIDPEYPTLLTILDNEPVLIMANLSVEEGPAAQINGVCMVVATENLSFDSVKSLYR